MGSAGEINGGGVKNIHPCKPVFLKYFVPKIRDNKADYFNEQLPPDQSQSSCISTNWKFVFYLLSFIIFSNYSEQRELFKTGVVQQRELFKNVVPKILFYHSGLAKVR